MSLSIVVPALVFLLRSTCVDAVSIHGSLTCANMFPVNPQTTSSSRISLHLPNYKGRQSIVWQIVDHPAFVVKIPRRKNDANLWLEMQPLYSPPSTNATFLNQYVPSTYACTFASELWSQKRKVLLQARVTKGFDLGTVPSDCVFGLQLDQTLQLFFLQLAIYENHQQDHSLFDISPSNVMFGEIKDRKKHLANLFHGDGDSEENGTTDNSNNSFVELFHGSELPAPVLSSSTNSSSSSSIENNMDVWLVDFTLYSSATFHRPDYMRNEKRNSNLWMPLNLCRHSGSYYLELFTFARANVGYLYSEPVNNHTELEALLSRVLKHKKHQHRYNY